MKVKPIPVPQSARVVVHHLRRFDGTPGLWTRYGALQNGIDGPPLSKGGLTLVQIEFADGAVARGSAQCSLHDNYDKATGRILARNRAMQIALKMTSGAVLSDA